MEMLGTDTDAGTGELAVVVGVGADGVEGTAEEGAPAVIAPVSRFTSFGGAVLPVKNSPAESAGSEDGAGG